MVVKKKSVKTIYKDIDLSRLYNLPNRLLPDEKIELDIVKFYKYYQNETDSIYSLFTKHLLKKLYRDNVDRNTNEIYQFYKYSIYNNILIEYNNLIDLIVIKEYGYDSFLNIEFNRVVEQSESESKYIVNFKITTLI